MGIQTGCEPTRWEKIADCCWVGVNSNEFDEVAPGEYVWNPGFDAGECVFRWYCGDVLAGVTGGDDGSEVHSATGISIQKNALPANVPNPLVVGSQITYTFFVTNTGSVPLNNITVTDPLGTVNTLNPPVSIPPGFSDSTSFSLVYTVTQADVDAGSISNTASVSAIDPDGCVITADSNTIELATEGDPIATLCPEPLTQLSDWEGCIETPIDIDFVACPDCDEVLESSTDGGLTWQAAQDPAGTLADCCMNNVQYRIQCEGDTTVPVKLDVWPDKFCTEGSKIIDPCGNEFFGVGMNVAFNTTTFPYVFEGVDNRPGPCAGAVDIWPGQANIHAGSGMLCYPGGGINSFSKNSPGLGPQPLPDRYYAINGYLSPTAQSLGITQPTDNWMQNIVRVNLVPQGAGGNPNLAQTLSAVIPATYEALDAGMVIMHETHQLTGDNVTPNAAWNAPASAFSGDFAQAVGLLDGIADEFKVDDTCDASHLGDLKEQGYVWFNPTNEPFTGAGFGNPCPTQAYFDTQTFWIERIRNFHGAENIIVIDLDGFAQQLGSLAVGCYDDWWQSLKDHPSGDLTRCVVLSWHAYGADTDLTGPYSYAKMDSDLNTVLNVKQFPLVTGEYGQASGPGGPNTAGPDQWNRNAVEYLTTNIHGQPLADKYNIHPQVWHATGDGSNFKQYSLTEGPTPMANDGLGVPFWDIQSGNDPLLEPLGEYHWDISHIINAKNTKCAGGPIEICVPEPSVSGPATFTFTAGEVMNFELFCDECPLVPAFGNWQQRAINGFYGPPTLAAPEGEVAHANYDGTCWRFGCFDANGNGSWSDPDVGASACFTIEIV